MATQTQSHPDVDDEKFEEGSDRVPDSVSNDNEDEKPVEAAADAEAKPNAAPQAPQGMPGGPPPNGGLQAWLQVLGAWMLFFNTWVSLAPFMSIAFTAY